MVLKRLKQAIPLGQIPYRGAGPRTIFRRTRNGAPSEEVMFTLSLLAHPQRKLDGYLALGEAKGRPYPRGGPFLCALGPCWL